MRTLIEELRRQGREGLEAYHLARPPFQERLAIAEATLLADVTNCPINLLHLSSGGAVDAGIKAQRDYPGRDIRLETTLHHLTLSHEDLEGSGGKVNPPIRTRAENEALWRAVLNGQIDQVVSDHACCTLDHKNAGTWDSFAGFGGTGLLYPVIVSEGVHRRGLSWTRAVELVAAEPARTLSIFPQKGTIAIGQDADFVVLDPNREAVVTPDLLLSAQDHTPFAGMTLRGWPTYTVRAGRVAFEDGRVVGQPDGRYLKRPIGLHQDKRVPVLPTA